MLGLLIFGRHCRTYTKAQHFGACSTSLPVAAAKAALPDENVSWIETPATDHGLYRIRTRASVDPSARFPHSFVWIDPASGGVLAIIDARRCWRLR